MNNNMKDRYSRQVLLKEIGEDGQSRLNHAKVAIVGLGALGTVAAELLTRAGIGSLLLIDRDVVEESNLQRQILFTEKDVGKSKSATAAEKLKEINSSMKIESHLLHLDSKNINLLQNPDLVLDCTDNLETRFLINDYCKRENIPWIYAAAIKNYGCVMPILPEGPCLSCFLQETNLETCDVAGVLNTITASIASLQVTLALKILLKKEIEPALYHYDIWNQQLRVLKIKKREICPACAGNYIYLNKRSNAKIVRFCSAGKYQIRGPKVNLEKVKERWKKIGLVHNEGGALQFKNILLFEDGRALITADSEEEAQSIYSRYVGN